MENLNIPFGYSISQGRANVNPEEVGKLKKLFQLYLEGLSMKECVDMTGIPHAKQTCRNMLSNPVYLGTDFYPQIIDGGLFDSVQKALLCRKRKTPERKRRKFTIPVYTEFELISGDSGKTAAEMYERIRIV